jgi:hypothetical protein
MALPSGIEPLSPALAAERVEVRRATVTGDYCFTVYQE